MSKRIVFMGTPDFAVPILQQLLIDEYEVVLVVTQPDRPKGRKKILTPPPVKTEAEKHTIPVFQPEKIKLAYKDVLTYNPDLIVTAAFGQILPKELLDAPSFGCINVHASLLPELRGGAPIHHAILQGRKETGVTIMYMVEKLDAGDILSQKHVRIEETDHVGILHDKLSEAGAALLKDTLPKLFLGEIEPVKQTESEATFAATIKREQEMIDWNRTHTQIYNHIRGLHPWPVAFTYYKDRIMKLWWAEMDERTFTADPGEIVDIQKDGFVVACGNGKGVKITSLQPAGKKRMHAGDFIRGIGSDLHIGDTLGESNG
ncbi:methionyl-tRNA formyltransferase [Terrihalobacillus insolitus]|uniref:methionyl-tRNA formyltransferase n=1 Tax=Terrihalobacillus insolitus TaxID=2950438 RepID=UPI00234095DF|nr:methionyl-tRNA formyltransferase [Terrihalobacillus insolitus]MDC3412895.1 methionyl-tRNA formyltransferase [Terrihalobacillus insolitus]